MTKLSLTDSERLILANQYEILGHLKNEDSYLHLAENLRAGHQWLYENYIAIEDNLPQEKVEHVLAILSIYSDLSDSYNELSDKSGIQPSQVVFPGFDGNNESELLAFARALERNGNFSETIGNPAKNSHSSTWELYRRMIGKWESMGKPRFPMSRQKILELVS